MTPSVPKKFGIESAAEADREIFRREHRGDRTVETVAAGASGRRFFRIRDEAGSRILMHYPAKPEENLFFSGIGRALFKADVPVPAILLDRPRERLVWLEDLGDRDLYSLKNSPDREHAYRMAIEALTHFQGLAVDLFERDAAPTLPPFDEELYRFEHNYFRKEWMARVAPEKRSDERIDAEMEGLLAQILGEREKDVWIHRDFQSKNLLIDPQGKFRIVDFQGFRRGHPFYDLASLLVDPYAELSWESRDSLFRHYCEITGKNPEDEAPAFARLGCQRLMQALGAYGKFGLGAGVTFFESRIGPALRLLEYAATEAGLTHLSRLAREAIERS